MHGPRFHSPGDRVPDFWSESSGFESRLTDSFSMTNFPFSVLTNINIKINKNNHTYNIKTRH